MQKLADKSYYFASENPSLDSDILKFPEVKTHGSCLPGIVLYVTIRPLDFRGLKNIWERDLASKFEIFRDAKHNLLRKISLPTKRNNPGGKSRRIRLPGTVLYVTVWPLDFKGLKQLNGKNYKQNYSIFKSLIRSFHLDKLLSPIPEAEISAGQNTS